MWTPSPRRSAKAVMVPIGWLIVWRAEVRILRVLAVPPFLMKTFQPLVRFAARSRITLNAPPVGFASMTLPLFAATRVVGETMLTTVVLRIDALEVVRNVLVL